MARKLIVEVVGDTSQLEKSYRRAEQGTKRFGQSVEKAGRGAVVASVGFRGLGRSVAFASSAFLGGAGIVTAITSTVQAAEESQRVLGQTRNAVERSGLAWGQYSDQIQKASLATAQLSGFDDEQLLATFSNLVRRTGDVNRALALNALAANVARGRNISLEQASGLVLKASIGNVGALRRLGISIGKHATALQALDLLQRKYAGSAAAYGETAAGAQDRFKVALGNLQETVGAQLLPSITKYLNKGADWLNQTKNQQRVARDVHDAVVILTTAIHAAGDVVKVAAGAFNTLKGAVGGTGNAVKVLLGIFATFKALKIAESVAGTAAALTRVGTEATGAAGKVLLLRGQLLRLVANPYTVTIALVAIGAEIVAQKIKDLQQQTLGAQTQTFKPGDRLETTLVPNLAKQIAAMKRSGQTSRQILSTLRQQLGGSLKADDLIAEAFAFGSGSDPALQARIRKQVAAAAGTVVKTAQDELGKKAKGATVEQRNAWFDAMINRQLGRVQDITSLKGQIARLGEIAVLIQQRIAATKDITRRFTLEDTLRDVLRTQRQTRSTLADQIKQHAQDVAAAAKAARQAAIDTKMGWLDFAVERAEATKTIKDDVKAQQNIIAYLKTRMRQEGRTLELVRGIWEARQRISDLNKSKSDVDPLAGLMQVSSSRLAGILAAGTGLDARGRRILGANIAGAEIQPLHVHVNIDGREVGRAVTQDQARTSRRTANQTSGRRG